MMCALMFGLHRQGCLMISDRSEDATTSNLDSRDAMHCVSTTIITAYQSHVSYRKIIAFFEYYLVF
ncbi:MAG: hypothetical protein WBO36_07455 [Saprospiraceae bacterium]